VESGGLGRKGSLLDAVDTLVVDGGAAPCGQGLVHGVLAELRENLELQTSDPSVRCVRGKARLAVGQGGGFRSKNTRSGGALGGAKKFGLPFPIVDLARRQTEH
jgi:hypothetical protein